MLCWKGAIGRNGIGTGIRVQGTVLRSSSSTFWGEANNTTAPQRWIDTATLVPLSTQHLLTMKKKLSV